MIVFRAKDASLFAGGRGRQVRLNVGLASMTSSAAGRLREEVDEILDTVDDCEVWEGVVEIVCDRSISSSSR